MAIKKIFFDKKQYQLTPEQKETIIGIMLSDGSLERKKANHNTRLRIDQSYPVQEKYVICLYNIFKPLVSKGPVINVRKPDKRTGKIYKSMFF